MRGVAMALAPSLHHRPGLPWAPAIFLDRTLLLPSNSPFRVSPSSLGTENRSRISITASARSRGSAFFMAAVVNSVRGVLFDMDGVLCDSEERSRDAAVEYFAELGFNVKPEDFIPYMGTGEANFLGGVAKAYDVKDFDTSSAKKRFFEIYIQKYAKPDSGLGFEGALDLILKCKEAGLKLAVASSADRIKVDANLSAAGLPQTNFDAIVSADLFEKLKPSPDIFLTAAKSIGVPPSECIVVEDALAGIQAAQAAGMRCIAVATTISEGELAQAGASLIRKNISDISLSDILDVPEQATSTGDSKQGSGFSEWFQTALDTKVELAGFGASRRDIIRFGSFGAGTYCLSILATRWKAMSYISPTSLLEDFLGTSTTSLVANGTEIDSSSRVEAFKKYISDLEAKGGRQKALEFPAGLQWFNSGPLRFNGALRGKVVILDFWTYCCINCMHVLPDLAYLENKYKEQPLIVVGVHSAKFDNEKDNDAIRNAVIRYNVQHPVVNDGDMTLWRQLGISSWPTLVLVSPQGRILAKLAGEGHRKDLDDLVVAALSFYGGKKLLNAQPIPAALEKDKDPRLLATPLQFPGKITTDLANKRLFVSDSNHHRIVVTDFDGNFILQVGCGSEGLQDGSFVEAAFNRPQGVAYNAAKNILYVTDTENHALREIDFVKETVTTLAGTGEKGADYKGGKKGTSQVLNSPWDVCFHPKDGDLYIAMAGQHQIWTYNLNSTVSEAFSGDGYERNLNGPRGSSSSYAQPSGLSLNNDMNEVYIADSESSSVRSVSVKTGGSRFISGGDPAFPENLFQFGDKDGPVSQAMFQHPLGVYSGQDGVIYVADSYNHKIKMINLSKGTVQTVAGTGVAGYRDGPAVNSQFSEPAGIAEGPNGTLFVADTNNNVIRVVNIGANNVTTLQLKGVMQPPTKRPRRLRKRVSSDMQVIRSDVAVTATSGVIELHIVLPTGYHFTKEAQSKYDVELEADNGILKIDPLSGVFEEGQATLRYELKAADNSSSSTLLRLISKVYYCQEQDVCLYKGIVLEIPFVPNIKNVQEDIPLNIVI